ncbi:MAG TPA: GGDEF domain-containing protein, partial [Candidatus Hydrogenedentes bacterium]|nr:GGDEF domain-containing protein [Candidatus Hydrogenedentota bacterium]
MMDVIVAGAVAVGILAGMLWMVRSRQKVVEATDVEQAEEPVSGLPAQAEESTEPNQEEHPAVAKGLEQAKLVVHSLLQSLSENVESLLDDSSNYGNSLDRHKAALRKANTVTTIRELERVMLTELEEMQKANTRYRKKLDDADTKLRNQREELTRLQSDLGADFLTKIPNRRAFDQRVGEEMSRAMRYGGTFSMVLLDLDHFKQVNDRHGHLAGDRILRAVAGLLQRNKRASDFLARYGGEEFVLLLPETSLDQARV